MNPITKLARDCQRASQILAELPTEQVLAAAEIVQLSVFRQIGQDIPHRRVAGGRVGVSVHPIRTGSAGASALVKADGPMHLENNPTQPHEIAVRTGRKSRGKAALNTPYGPKNKVNHPGTKGKFTWQHGVDQARPLITAAVQKTGASIIAGLFR